MNFFKLFILLFPINCFACKLGLTDIVYQKPELAQTVMLVKVVEHIEKDKKLIMKHSLRRNHKGV